MHSLGNPAVLEVAFAPLGSGDLLDASASTSFHAVADEIDVLPPKNARAMGEVRKLPLKPLSSLLVPAAKGVSAMLSRYCGCVPSFGQSSESSSPPASVCGLLQSSSPSVLACAAFLSAFLEHQEAAWVSLSKFVQ